MAPRSSAKRRVAASLVVSAGLLSIVACGDGAKGPAADTAGDVDAAGEAGAEASTMVGDDSGAEGGSGPREAAADSDTGATDAQGITVDGVGNDGDDNDAGAQPDATTGPDAASYDPDRFITSVVSFTPGPGSGFGQNRLPGIVYGPPHGVASGCSGSTDVCSLGNGGEIVVEFVNNAIVDGPGVDLLVFENPFVAGCGDPSMVYAEPGEVSVSDDGVNWSTFPCTATSYPYGQCAGWHPVYSSPTNGISPLDPATAGGDPFDLADLGITHAKYVRVRDMGSAVDATGFDLDAMAIVMLSFRAWKD